MSSEPFLFAAGLESSRAKAIADMQLTTGTIVTNALVDKGYRGHDNKGEAPDSFWRAVFHET